MGQVPSARCCTCSCVELRSPPDTEARGLRLDRRRANGEPVESPADATPSAGSVGTIPETRPAVGQGRRFDAGRAIRVRSRRSG